MLAADIYHNKKFVRESKHITTICHLPPG